MNPSGDDSTGHRFKFGGAWQEFVERVKRNWRACSIGALIVAAAGFVLTATPAGRTVAEWSYDLPFRWRGVVYPNEAALVYMDELSHKELQQPYDKPWDRTLHAELLNKLTAEHVKAVVFDIVFDGPGPSPEADQQFIAAITNNGKVVLAADFRKAGFGTVNSESAKTFDLPYRPFYRAVRGRCGSDVVYSDDDDVVRRELPADRMEDRFSSEGWTVAQMLGATVTQNESNRFVPFYLNYYGPSGTIKGVSFSKVLRGSEIPTNYFENKIVFVGARFFTKYSGERKDEYPTPFSYLTPENPMTGGVEIQATAFLNILRDERLLRLPIHLETGLLVVCGLLAGFGFTLLRPMAASVVAGATAGLAALVNYILFTRFHTWFTWEAFVLVQVPMAWVFSISVNSVQLYVEKQKVEQSLSLYLSPKLVKKFARNPKLLKPGAEKQLLTILFTDIANFTTISEGMDSDHLAKAMNDYFQTAVHNCIHFTDGTVVKYIGDAIFSFWNAPDLQNDHAWRACEAALLFCDQPPQFMNGVELITRIGLHTGVANVGNFGSMTRVDYTALGENINLASRMEGLNKYLGTRVLITDETQKLAAAKIITRFLGEFRLKGFERSVGVYELMGRAADEAKTNAFRDAFAKALGLFQTGNWDGAEGAFRLLLEMDANDGPTQFYLKQIEELRTETLPTDWKGEIVLKDK